MYLPNESSGTEKKQNAKKQQTCSRTCNRKYSRSIFQSDGVLFFTKIFFFGIFFLRALAGKKIVNFDRRNSRFEAKTWIETIYSWQIKLRVEKPCANFHIACSRHAHTIYFRSAVIRRFFYARQYSAMHAVTSRFLLLFQFRKLFAIIFETIGRSYTKLITMIIAVF